MSGVLILGAGGHGKVVADALRCMGIAVRGFLDDNPATWGGLCLGLPILGPGATYQNYAPDGLVIGIGANHIRQQVVERLGETAHDLWINAIHPSAVIADSVTLGRGLVVAARTVINPDTVIGDHVIINTGATVDHDCAIEDYVHIAPGVHLAGGIRVGEGTLVGIGAVALPGLSIGRWATVGGGAAVTQSIPDRVVARGVPARWS